MKKSLGMIFEISFESELVKKFHYSARIMLISSVTATLHFFPFTHTHMHTSCLIRVSVQDECGVPVLHALPALLEDIVELSGRQ